MRGTVAKKIAKIAYGDNKRKPEDTRYGKFIKKKGEVIQVRKRKGMIISDEKRNLYQQLKKQYKRGELTMAEINNQLKNMEVKK